MSLTFFNLLSLNLISLSASCNISMLIERRYGELSHKVIGKRGMGCRVSVWGVVSQLSLKMKNVSEIYQQLAPLYGSLFFETHKGLVGDLQKKTDS